jgi:hypothetical protein
MAVAVLCPICNRGSRIADELLGQEVQCPYCFDVFEAVRDANAPPEPPPPPPTAALPAVDAVPEAELLTAPAAVLATDEEILTVEAAPAPAVRAFQPIRFIALITRDPDGTLKGRMLAEISADGLRLSRQDGRINLQSPVGATARYLGQNRLAVTVQGREIQMLVFKANARQEQLARDVAAFLNGKRPTLNPHSYSAVWYLIVASLLPLTLPLLALPMGMMHGFGVVLWLMTALLLTGGGMTLVWRGWHPGLRFMSIVGLAVVGFVLLPLGLALGLGPPPRIDNYAWTPFASDDGRFQIRFPNSGAVGMIRRDQGRMGNQAYTIYTLDLPRHQAVFSAASIDLAAAGMPFQNPAAVFNERISAFQREHNAVLPALEQSPWPNQIPGQARQVMMHGGDINGALSVRMYIVRNHLFILSVSSSYPDQQKTYANLFFSYFALGRLDGPPSPMGFGGLICYLSFDDADPTRTLEQAARRHSFQLQNVVRIADGARDKAVRFFGRNNRIDYNDAEGLSFAHGTPFTFAGWVRTHANSGTLFAQRQRENPNPRLWLHLWNNSLRFVVGGDKGQAAQVVGDTFMNNGAWHHFAVTRESNGELRLYIDGIRQGAAPPVMLEALPSNVRSLGCECYEVEHGGGQDDANFFQGDLDEFCVFNRALGAEEIQRLAGKQG